MSHGYVHNGLVALTFSLNNKTHHKASSNKKLELAERKISTTVRTCNRRIEGWTPWPSITHVNQKLPSLLGTDHWFCMQYPIIHANQSAVFGHKLKFLAQTITSVVFSQASSRAHGIQPPSPICPGLRINKAPKFERLTLSVQNEGRKCVTIDATATGDPERSCIITSHPFHSLTSLSWLLLQELNQSLLLESHCIDLQQIKGSYQKKSTKTITIFKPLLTNQSTNMQPSTETLAHKGKTKEIDKNPFIRSNKWQSLSWKPANSWLASEQSTSNLVQPYLSWVQAWDQVQQNFPKTRDTRTQ